MGNLVNRITPGSPIQDSGDAIAESHLANIPKYQGVMGWLMGRTGSAVIVQDTLTKQEFYIRISDIVQEMVKESVPISPQSKALIAKRVLEITDPDTRKSVSYEKLKSLFAAYFTDLKKKPEQLDTEDGLISEVETIKQKLSDIPQLEYTDHISELAGHLKPGDFIVRKYHEDNDNIICDLQQFFHIEGYREAYKCSHIAIYLGEIQGSHWIAEASMPHDGEPEIRRIKIDDPRFNAKQKNQYLIIRNKNQETAAEAARLAKNYAIKMLPASEKEISEEDAVGSFHYNYVEALRSLWHSPSLAFFGRHRLLKYYSDYKNGIPFEYFGEKRAFFCSHFAMIMESMAEMNKSEKFQNFWKEHPAPAYHKGGGKISDLWYSIKKGLWARWMSFWHSREINESVSTQLDALRTSPHTAVNYMMTHTGNFEVVALINRKGDLE